MEKRTQSSTTATNTAIEKYTDDEIIKILLQDAKESEIFSVPAAWEKYNIGDGSQSGADLYLCSRIATYSRVPDQIDRIFTKSALYRDKWERADYKQKTIDLALKKKPDPAIFGLGRMNGSAVESNIFRPTWTNKPVSDPITLKLNGVRCGSAGNLTSIVALAGIGKSSICEAISSAAINPYADNLGFAITVSNPRILYIDTERVHADQWTSWRRMMCKANVLEGTFVDRVDWCAIVTLATVEEKRKFLEKQLETHKYDFVILDTITDFLTDVNSIEQTAEVSNWIRGLANIHGFTAILTIHSNPSAEGQNKARGHLGSELLRRSETIFKLDYDKSIDQRTLTTSFIYGKNRSADVAETYFAWDENKEMFTSIGNKRKNGKGKKGVDYDALAFELIGKDWTYTELVNHIVDIDGVSLRTAKNRISDLVDLGLLNK
jgi:hypothetical protein